MASIQRALSRSILRIVTGRSTFQRGMCTMKDLDKPVKFSSSEAATWKAAYSRSGSPDSDTLWCETHIVLASVTSFLIYFCYLREENDLDAALEMPLGSRIEGLEEAQLRVVLQYNLDKGLPTEDISKRLEQLERERALQSPSQ